MKLFLIVAITLISGSAAAQNTYDDISEKCETSFDGIYYLTSEEYTGCMTEYDNAINDNSDKLENINDQIKDLNNALNAATDQAAKNSIIENIKNKKNEYSDINKIILELKGRKSAVQNIYRAQEMNDINLNKFRHSNENEGFNLFNDPFDSRSDKNITNRLIRLMLRILPTLAILLVAVGGYYFVMSTSADSTKNGAKVIGFAIGGLVLAYTSYIIVQFVLSILFTNVV